MAKYTPIRCPTCNMIGSPKYMGYCKHCCPYPVMDCPVCGARGWPKYDGKCDRHGNPDYREEARVNGYFNKTSFFRDTPFYTDKYDIEEEGYRTDKKETAF